MTQLDLSATERKWQERWEKAKLFEAEPLARKKFMLTFPYPYMNGFLHIGHFYTLMRVDVLARYKRLQGYNVLFPQGWHCTGSPIEAAAKRIRDKEPKQWASMRKMGFKEKEIEAFADPEHWTAFFPREAKIDYQRMGMSVDFRRSFITTSLNPYYDRFIRWQFRKLKEKGYVTKGEHPVVWDPKLNMPVGDHDRSEGEGETPQEFLLVKHRLDDDRYLVSATLRPDTILGLTNIYVHPDYDYQEIEIETAAGTEHWILGESAIKRLEEQDWKLRPVGTIKGQDLIGKETEEFGDRKVPVLPATFLDPEVGTGLVHSVPSESADDLIALWDLKKDEKLQKKYGLDKEMVAQIEPIEILDLKGIGGNPAKHFLEKYGVKHQDERKKLDRIRAELYKLSFYNAKFGSIYKGVFGRDIVGRPIQEEMDYVKEQLIEQGWAAILYQLTGRVVSRNLNECIVKIVRDQWFINYGDPAWKELAREALRGIRLYPEKARAQFEHVIGWLHSWACAREYGLGTKLPWDPQWVIESLSDSTLYNAYYTVAHLLTKMPLDKVNDALFDHILLGKGTAPSKEAEQMRKSFTYWYPVDFRNSGKDLIQNHLTFYIFNHVALLPRKYWPRGIGVNGWVVIDGQKMSKSLGNMILLRDMADKFNVDPSRLTIMSGGESLDDPNWDSGFAAAIRNKLIAFHDFCLTHHGKGNGPAKETPVDAWMESRLNSIVKETTLAMEETLFRTASQKAFFELNQDLRWYLKRTNNRPNRSLMDRILESQVIMMAPFVPFLCEEIWEKLGKKGFVSVASWPKHDDKLIRPELDALEKTVADSVQDIQQVLKLAKVETPKKLTLFVASPWKYELYALLAREMKATRNPKELIPRMMAKESIKKHGQEVMRILQRILKSGRIPEAVSSEKEEFAALQDARVFLQEEFGAEIEVIRAGETEESKAAAALPGKPAILVA
ncbi:MAG: leucine--tRNA ligase [DPANN group archaeon]|nr:leucine--tRNA ligase [DPANN group archaeon]